MGKLFALFLVFVLVLAACGGDDDDDDVAGIEDAETCDEVGAAFISELQVLLDELSDVSMADVAGGEEPEALVNFENSLDEIGGRGDELGCSEDEIADYLLDNIDDLEAEGPVAELLLEGFREGVRSGEIFD